MDIHNSSRFSVKARDIIKGAVSQHTTHYHGQTTNYTTTNNGDNNTTNNGGSIVSPNASRAEGRYEREQETEQPMLSGGRRLGGRDRNPSRRLKAKKRLHRSDRRNKHLDTVAHQAKRCQKSSCIRRLRETHVRTSV
ncbi:hypothetical protein Moror_12132 [Moniliophthora roreri MCA 2997]|uniref:Uncharacterized protein n=1 Tax=Moniliophthora roreri (strain MCA 2997) TaxID=1381753 RepID=V2WI98_MONRO|nr:hypothetical protein Moror_12132 [Moniliophthora roreri MCA 2997]